MYFLVFYFVNIYSNGYFVKRYVRIEYEPVFGIENIAKRFNDASYDSNNHFVEGIQYSLDEAVIITGVMVSDHEVDYRKVTSIKNENYFTKMSSIQQ